MSDSNWPTRIQQRGSKREFYVVIFYVCLVCFPQNNYDHGVTLFYNEYIHFFEIIAEKEK